MTAPALSDLDLDLDRLEEVRRALVARVAAGLEADGREIRALPAYFPPPPRGLGGEALVMDCGGTNMRAARVSLQPGSPAQVIAGPLQRRLPVREEGGDLDGPAFFDLQASLLAELEPPPGLPVGYCFSYPSEVLPSRDAKLIAWTKGVDIPGVVGQPVGEALGEALGRAGLSPSRVRVLNDTVASILAAALSFPGHRGGNVVGLIVGTGTNMAGFFDCARAPKLASRGLTGRTAVNLESGNFRPPHLSAWDEALDAASNNPGAQRFEKAVSGYYLPFLFQHILPDHPGFDPLEGAGKLRELRDESSDETARAVAGAILARSADLVAAGLAAVLDFYPEDEEVGILAEGSTFWRDPLYAPRVAHVLDALLAGRRAVHFLKIDDANLLGSAAAALVD